MNEVVIKKDDVIKQMYFVLSLVQKSNNPMHSRTSNKDDYMGGIIDRFVNTLPENVIFTKVLLPKLNTSKKVELIRDFYSYSPSEARIAPDLLGIKVDGNIVPFAVYDDGWKPVEGCPQVEIKTLKERQYMLSLVDQGYEKSYLAIVESNFNVDYLMPFINKDLFPDSVYSEIINELDSYKEKLIINDTNGYVNPLEKLKFNTDELGSIKILLITKSTEFMKQANFLAKGVSPQLIRKIEECTEPRGINPIAFSKVCDDLGNNYFRFNDEWYKYKDKNGVCYRTKDKIITLDFYCSNIKDIQLLKVNKGNFYIKVNKELMFNKTKLCCGYYKMELFTPIDRESSRTDEYFIDKNIYEKIQNYENDLLNDINEIINKY